MSFVCGLILLVLPAAARAASLAVVVGSNAARVGDLVRVDLQVSGLGDLVAPALGTFDVTLAFDPLVLDPLSVEFGDPILGDQLDVLGLGSVKDFSFGPGPGIVNLFEVSLDSPADLNLLQAGSFTLGSIVFSARAPGTTALILVVNAFGDAFATPLAFEVMSGSVAVARAPQPVPEPESAALLLLGCGAMLLRAASGRRRPPCEFAR